MKPFERDMHGGGATCARPEIRRMMSASDRWKPDPATARTEAVTLTLNHAPARTQAFVADAGAPVLKSAPTPHPKAGPPQARFHPRPGCRPARTGTGDRSFSGGWLGPLMPKGTNRLPAETRSFPPPLRHCRTLRQHQKGLPPAWLEAFTIHPAAGARKVWHRDWRVGKKWARYCSDDSAVAFSPLVGEKAKS